MPNHDPIEFASHLAQQLASRSRHVCLLLGAGVSKACGLPDVAGLQEHVSGGLDKEQREIYQHLLEERDLEQVLTRLRRLAELLGEGQELDGLTAQAARELDLAICRCITAALHLDDAQCDPMHALAGWALRAAYHQPLEIFTLNYDLLVEAALDSARALYFDGFVGTVSARFQPELIEPDATAEAVALPPAFVRLWKLHGSVNWGWVGQPQEVVRLGAAVQDDRAAAIYPSDAKYDESRRVPFVALMDRLRRSLLEPETLVLVTGYSWRDQHINELIFDAASRRERSVFYVLCHDAIPDEVAERALSTPSLTVASPQEAIWGADRSPWTERDDLPGIWEEGRFLLGDFARLAPQLARDTRSRSAATDG